MASVNDGMQQSRSVAVLSELSWLRFLVEVCRDFDLMAAWQRFDHQQPCVVVCFEMDFP